MVPTCLNSLDSTNSILYARKFGTRSYVSSSDPFKDGDTNSSVTLQHQVDTGYNANSSTTSVSSPYVLHLPPEPFVPPGLVPDHLYIPDLRSPRTRTMMRRQPHPLLTLEPSDRSSVGGKRTPQSLMSLSDCYSPIQPSHHRRPSITNRGDETKQYFEKWTRDMKTRYLKLDYRAGESSDFVVFYDEGYKLLKAHKFILISDSKWFEKALSGSFKEAFSFSIRLQGDFPFAIQAMFDFIYTSTYSFEDIHSEMFVRFPLTTELDFHVLAYVAGDKYDVPKLRSFASKQFLRVARDILSQAYSPIEPQEEQTFTIFEDSDLIPPVADIADQSVFTNLDRLFNATTLLWSNTALRSDPLRWQFCEMIKMNIMKLAVIPQFLLAMERHEDFAEDVRQAFMDDGLDIVFERGGENARSGPIAFA